MNTKYLKAIEEFGKVPKSKELIKHSLNEIKSNKENIFGTIMSALLGAFFALWMGFSINTIELFHKALEILLNVQLVIFGFIFSIYSIILAFFSDDYVEKIVQVDDESKKPFLIKILTYYEYYFYIL